MNAPHRHLRVLLVDDHPMVRAGIRVALRKHYKGVQIEEAGSAAEALARISACRPHIVMLDVNLPDMNGLDLARQIHASDPHLKLLMVAAEADPWAVKEALDAGASGFVAKTSSHVTLSEAVRSVLAGTVFLCPLSRAALRRAETYQSTGPGALSQREGEVLRHLANGDNTKTIAAKLEISPKTVETHRQHIMRKLGTNSVADLVRYAIRHGLSRP